MRICKLYFEIFREITKILSILNVRSVIFSIFEISGSFLDWLKVRKMGMMNKRKIEMRILKLYGAHCAWSVWVMRAACICQYIVCNYLFEVAFKFFAPQKFHKFSFNFIHKRKFWNILWKYSGALCIISMSHERSCMHVPVVIAACIGFKFRNFFQILVFGRFSPKSAKCFMVHCAWSVWELHACAGGNCGAACIGFKFRHFRQARQRHCASFRN